MAFIDALPRLRQAGFLPVHGVSPSLIEMFSPPAGFAPAGFFWKKHSAFSTQHSANLRFVSFVWIERIFHG
ncbi:MAG: hypothetical protein DMG60_20095 [Acidobacteria bacterium]|nr:MAG: hypothetical protein DMG60_20095 [Acidobacteriota bacterium]